MAGSPALNPASPPFWFSVVTAYLPMSSASSLKQESKNVLFVFLAGHLFIAVTFLISCFL